MEHTGFTQGVELALAREDKFERAAYFFLRDALEFSLSRKRADEDEGGSRSKRDVRGGQLALGFRDHALNSFGPMASVVLDEWGVQRSEHVGEMVYLLIELGVFGRSDEDQQEDFAGQWTRIEDLEAPFRAPSQRGEAAMEH